MSAVYLGRRVAPADDVPSVVALKIARHDVAKDEHLARMFIEEGKLIARLVHPCIVRTLEVGGDAGHDFIAMELMLGKTFAAIHDALAERGSRLNEEIAAFTAARVADALHYAHELRDEGDRPLALVHRDVNPANVFATFGGEVKLFDFGLAKMTADERSGQQLIAGKLSYLSPEQIMQMPLDRRSDVFSLGTTLWELLTGKRLFLRSSDVETVRAVQLGPIPDPRAIAPEIPEDLARIAKTALERNRDHRYPDAAALARELDAFVLSRTTFADVQSRLAQLVDALFPGEQKRQSGWLKPAIGSSASRTMPAVATPKVGASHVPPAKPTQLRYDSREVAVVTPASLPPVTPASLPPVTPSESGVRRPAPPRPSLSPLSPRPTPSSRPSPSAPPPPIKPPRPSPSAFPPPVKARDERGEAASPDVTEPVPSTKPSPRR